MTIKSYSDVAHRAINSLSGYLKAPRELQENKQQSRLSINNSNNEAFIQFTKQHGALSSKLFLQIQSGTQRTPMSSCYISEECFLSWRNLPRNNLKSTY